MKQYKHLLFDLDGTIIDPKVGITKSVQYALAKMGIQIDQLDLLEKFIGPPLRESFSYDYGYNPEETEKAVSYFREYYQEKGVFELKVYEGIQQLFEALINNGYKLYLATSKPELFAKQILDHLNLSRFFTFITGSTMDKSREKKADVIAHIFNQKELGINKNEAIMIGDKKHDLIGANHHNIDSIAVSYGYGSIEELKKEDPTFLVDSVTEIGVVFIPEYTS